MLIEINYEREVKCVDINRREQEILSAVIRAYIITGEPVGSKTLGELMSLGVSSATIRAKMNELCELGLLNQPHTSAGRVPTAAGYRYYVERLMGNYSLSEADKRMIDELIGSYNGVPEKLLDNACEALAQLTGCAAMVTSPNAQAATISQIKLLPIGKYTVMTVLVTSSGVIKSRVAKLDEPLSNQQLERIAALLESELVGMSPDDVSAAASQTLLIKLGIDFMSAAPIVAAVADAASQVCSGELLMKGEKNLIEKSEFSATSVRALISLLHNRSALLGLLHSPRKELTVVLGDETGDEALFSSGVIVARYRVGKSSVGSIGILGPQRMDYEHIIPGILYFRDNLGKLLQDSYERDI